MPSLAERFSSRREGGTDELVERIRALSRPLHTPSDLDPLLERIGDARVVLLGEASHGTSEHYVWRAWITARLVREKGFCFIAVEGDWPDCYAVNRWIKGLPDSGDTARNALQAFGRWPTWMWGNWEIEGLVRGLRAHNVRKVDSQKVGFYGLDVYSLRESIEAVIAFLEGVDPATARAARDAYGCFEPYADDAQDYAWASRFVPELCEEEAVNILLQMQARRQRHNGDGREAEFDAEQNALVVKHAADYYRAMVRGGPESWNVRDCHMAETLDRLLHWHGDGAKCVVWEHNTHIGDARYTDMADDGMLNIGQLVRERYGKDNAVLVCLGSYKGTVVAGDSWGAPMERMEVPPAREGSWEAVFRAAGFGSSLLLCDALRGDDVAEARRGHRAIGVVYRPESERFGNYVPTNLPYRYDAFIYLDRTHALHPFHLVPHPGGDLPDTFPWNE